MCSGINGIMGQVRQSPMIYHTISLSHQVAKWAVILIHSKALRLFLGAM